MIKNTIILLAILLCLVDVSIQLCDFEMNIDYFGNDINPTAPVYLSTQELCCQLCQNTAECQAWTYVPLTQACWLKRNIGNLRVISAGRNSGVKIQTGSGTITTTNRVSICLIENNVNYPGNDLQPYTTVQTNIPSAVECCNLCGSTSTCLAFVYSINDRFCWLKTTTHGPANRQVYTGLISGIVTQR